MIPLTSERIERIKEASVGTELAYGVHAMAAEIDRLANALSDCWLLMDSVARGQSVTCPGIPGNSIQEVAAALLRKQKAPGWKS